MTASVRGYVLGELLGAGGMGRVFATATSSMRPAVVKLLHESLMREEFFVRRFHEEARAARAVQHRNVVRVIDDGVTESGTPFLVMDRVDGTPLGVMIRRDGPLSLQRIRHLAAQILAGVGAIHRAGLVHGDVKSDNVLVDANDQMTIIDFGLAHASSECRALEDGMISGTPEYMAPEVIAGGPVTPISELYAVGVILYEMLTGTTPFSGGTSAEICVRHLTDDVVPPSLRAPDRAIPVPLETTIMRALAKDPVARHPTAEFFAAAVECAIPAGVHEEVSGAFVPAFSTSSPTRNWTRRGAKPAASEQVVRRRNEASDAVAVGDPDAVIAAYLALAYELVRDHGIAEATRELELALTWLRGRTTPVSQTWSILMTLAALCDGQGDHESAASYAREAREMAIAFHNDVGVARVNQLLRRLDVCSRRRRQGAV